MVSVLILGGAGFMGYHLTRYLAQQLSYRVTLVDNLSRGELDNDLQELLGRYSHLEMVTADLSVPESFTDLGGPFDHVYLLAGIVGVRNVESHPERVIHLNTSIILNTLEWIRRVGCGRLLFASTSETYAGSVELGIAQVPTAEDAPVAVLDIRHPRYSYAVTKMLGEAAVTHYTRAYGFEAVIARYHNIYGPRMGFDHVVPELMERIGKREDPFPVYGLEQTRAFCYVADAIEASHALMHCALNECELVHIGNDQEEITIEHLLAKLFDIADFHPVVKALPAPGGAVSRRCPDISKLWGLIGTRPQVGLSEGLVRTWDWYHKRMEHSVSIRRGE